MKKQHFLAVILSLSLMATPFAEAKRAGGGKSVGMSRQSSSYSRNNNNNYNNGRYQQQQMQQAQQAQFGQSQGSGIGKMVAAGVAGAAIGSMATSAFAGNHAAEQQALNATAEQGSQDSQFMGGHQNMLGADSQSGSGGWLWLLLLGAAGFFLYRKFGAPKLAAAEANARNNAGLNAGFNTTRNANSSERRNVFGDSLDAKNAQFNNEAAMPAVNLPDGINNEQFLRIARQRFNHIQAMNSASNIEEIRRYLTPDLYQSMKQDILANRDEDVAEFTNLQTEIVDFVTENGQFIASVRFSGLVSEELGQAPVPFAETWHFVKNIEGNGEWLLAGIQQDNH